MSTAVKAPDFATVAVSARHAVVTAFVEISQDGRLTTRPVAICLEKLASRRCQIAVGVLSGGRVFPIAIAAGIRDGIAVVARVTNGLAITIARCERPTAPASPSQVPEGIVVPSRRKRAALTVFSFCRQGCQLSQLRRDGGGRQQSSATSDRQGPLGPRVQAAASAGCSVIVRLRAAVH